MSNVTIKPSKLLGTVQAPPSKSDVHRAIICAALSKGKSVIHPVAFSEDILATIDCIKALGANVSIEGNRVIIDSADLFKVDFARLNCRESGSTVRFFIPVAAAGGVNAVFDGKGRLPQRPLGVYTELLPKHNVKCVTKGGLPFEISGRLTSGKFDVPGDISSQFITGLLFALPLLDGDSVIHLTSPLQSKGYIDMTIAVMEHYGVTVTKDGEDYIVKGNQSYKSGEYITEGDWSQAAFFLVGGAIGGEVTVNGVKKDSYQGDREITEILRRFGASIEQSEMSVKCSKGELKAIEIDASQIPDLVPVLTVCASFAKGQTRIYNAQRVRLKESDRLAAITDCLNRCGAKISETEDGLIIDGVESLDGGFAEGFNDHRIVMSMAVAALKSKNEITVSDRESITKSYSEFFEDYNSVGGKSE
ncbi:MAG: 3-phosphoshikimate 1-carboxyvinyltransferase [Lachnospiraceae bacterium]|nr:3-phosphoshikimate 1-carboxyvinyltransferase [Lachnospiraceae bacterium]